MKKKRFKQLTQNFWAPTLAAEYRLKQERINAGGKSKAEKESD
jgi:hypothetical protein